MFDLDAMRAFAAFAEKLNFTRAADALHISQPALHVKIRKLGEELGVSLYERRGRNLHLTAAGRRVAGFAHDTASGVDEFVASLRGETRFEPVVLAAGEGSLLYLLTDAIREYVRTATMPLRVLTRDRDGMLTAVRSGAATLGVGTLDVLPPDLAVTHLVRADQVVVVPRGHPLARKRTLRPEDLEHQSLILPPADRPHRELIARVLLGHAVAWSVAVEASGWPVMLELARAGAGVAIVNRTCRLPAGVVCRRITGFPATHYHLVERRGRRSEGQRTLAELIRSTTRRGSAT